MSNLAKSHAHRSSALGQLLCLYLLVLIIQWLVSFIASSQTDNRHVVKLFENSAALLLVIGLISHYRIWHEIGWFSVRHIKRFVVFLVPTFYILLNLGERYNYPPLVIFEVGLNTLISASFEELLCRVLALHILIKAFALQGDKRPILSAVLYSAVLFGLAHLANIVNHPDAVGAIIGQMIYASFIGVGFAACYLVTQSLLPLIVIHGAINFMSFLSDSGMEPDALTFEDTLGTVIVCLPLFVFGLWLLRKEPVWHDANLDKKRILTITR